MTATTGNPPPCWPTRIWRILLISLIFLLLGPPLGALVLFASLAVINLGATDPQGTFSVILFGLIFGGFFSYFVGGLPAALVGLAIGTWHVLVGRVTWPIALTVGIGAGLTVLAFFSQRLIAEYDGDDLFPQQFSAMVMLVCTLPTMACWAIVRNWYRPAPAAAAAAPTAQARP